LRRAGGAAMKVVLALAIGRRRRFGAQLGQWCSLGI
jgi:hypothetical protein